MCASLGSIAIFIILVNTYLSSEVWGQAAPRRIKQQNQPERLTNNATIQSQETTANLSDEVLFRRMVIYVGLIMGFVCFLVMCSAVVTFRKTKTIDIGPLEYKKGMGWL